MPETNAQVITGESARKSAKIFHYGNIVAGLIPVPFFVLWFGGSMLAYALLRFHPNPRVGYYTQWGAYVYYGWAGLLVPVLTFAPGDFFKNWWWLLWAISVAVLLPISINFIRKINQEQWSDVPITSKK